MAFFIEGQVIVQLTDFIGQRSFSRFLLVEAEAVDEIAASTSMMDIGVKRNFWPSHGFRVTYQAKFQTSAKFLIYSCMSVVSLLSVIEQTLAINCLLSVAKIRTCGLPSGSPQ